MKQNSSRTTIFNQLQFLTIKQLINHGPINYTKSTPSESLWMHSQSSRSSPLLTDVFDEELRVAQTLLVDDELAEDESRLAVAMRSDDGVEGDAGVVLARCGGVHRRAAGLRARRPLVRSRRRTDERVAEQHTSNEHVQRLTGTWSNRPGICTRQTSSFLYRAPSITPPLFHLRFETHAFTTQVLPCTSGLPSFLRTAVTDEHWTKIFSTQLFLIFVLFRYGIVW